MIIKLLLLSGLAVAAVLAYRSTRSARSLALRRVGMVLILSTAVIAVALPATVTALANAVGVGRGADLVLYALVIVSLLVWIRVYRRLHDTEARLVELSRRIALDKVTHQDDVTLSPTPMVDSQ